jgi:hypothetical protein
MKKIALSLVSCLLFTALFAQEDTVTTVSDRLDNRGRTNDHFMVQVGYVGWAGIPDTINTGGFSKTVNVYLMFNFPFKTNPKLSMALGAGIGSDGIKFKKTYVGIKEQTAQLQFRDQSDTNHFKRTKLSTAYLEAPIEFRYTANPANADKSFKFAVGVKVGLLINAHTRNKTFQTKSGGLINDYTMKEASKSYFNSTRLVGIARVGWGHFSLFGSYQVNALFKEGVAANVRPFSIGLALSGL